MGLRSVLCGLIAWLALVSAPSLAFAAHKSVSPADLAAIHSIAVISAIGDKAVITRVGTTVFGNKESERDIAGWGLDELAAKDVGAALAPRFQVTSVTADKAAFTPHLSGGLLGFEAMPEVSDLVRRLPPSDVDAYLVIVKSPQSLYPYNQQVEGIGMYLHKGPFGEGKKPTVYATFSVALVRARTGEVLAQRIAQAPSPYSPTATAPFPLAIGAAEDWADTAAELSPAQAATLRGALEGLLAKALALTLSRMGLHGAAQ